VVEIVEPGKSMVALFFIDAEGRECQADNVNQLADAYRSRQINSATLVRDDDDRSPWIRAAHHELFCRVRQIIDDEGLNYVPRFEPAHEAPSIIPDRNSGQHRLRIRVLLRGLLRGL
jgi:hypothetical protein